MLFYQRYPRQPAFDFFFCYMPFYCCSVLRLTDLLCGELLIVLLYEYNPPL